MEFSIILEKNVLKLGEPIRGELRSEFPIHARLYVVLSSILFPRAESIARVMTLHREDFILRQGSFEIAYPKDLPPSINARAHRIRWGLLFGIPRLKGKFMFPRKDVRLKVYPAKPEVRRESWLDFDKEFYRSDERVRALIKERVDPSEAIVELEAEEWLSYRGERRELRYFLSDGKILSEGGKLIAEATLPHDPTTVKEVSFFFPYTFSFSRGDLSFGAKVNLVLTTKEGERRAEVPVWTGEPRYGRAVEGPRGPLF